MTLRETVAGLGIPDATPVFMKFKLLNDRNTTAIRGVPGVLSHLKRVLGEDGGALVRADFETAIFVKPGTITEVEHNGVLYVGELIPRDKLFEDEETSMAEPPSSDLELLEISDAEVELLERVKSGEPIEHDDEAWLLENGLLIRVNGKVSLSDTGHAIFGNATK